MPKIKNPDRHGQGFAGTDLLANLFNVAASQSGSNHHGERCDSAKTQKRQETLALEKFIAMPYWILPGERAHFA